MPSDLRWGIGVPQIFPDQPVDMSLVRRWIPRAEQLGFDSLWTMEGITGGLATLEPVTLLSYMSALTERVKLGVSVIIAPHRNPVQLAKALGSLDTINRGRLILGIGLGHRIMSDAFGISAEHRVTRFTEIMDVLKALWTQPQANHSGRFWKLQDTQMEPKPVQKPHPPIWLGGGHPRVLRRAVHHADGWMGAGASSTEQFVENMGRLRSYLEEAGRDPASFAVSKRVYLAVDSDEARAETRLRTWFGHMYRNPDMANRVSVWGSPSTCAEKLAEVADAGAGMIMLNPVYDHIEQMEALSSDVIPNV